MAVCAFLSFRLGLTDGVSTVAEKWRQQIEAMGWETITIAGEGPVDRTLPGLAIGADGPPDPDELRAALEGVDLVVVENLLTIPLHLRASEVVADVLRGRPALLHHHDPPWQRERFRHVTSLPPHEPEWRHVTINRLTEQQFRERGFEATTIYNGFDTRATLGDRGAMRTELEVGSAERLVVHPARAIPRKDIPAAIALAEHLGGTYWLTGPAEDGYDEELRRILAASRCRVIHRPAESLADLYAAADLVVFPSLWEGFGNPPVEASIHLRPTTVGPYPVRAELLALGFEWLDHEDRPAIEQELERPDHDRRRRNRALADRWLSTEALRNRLEDLFDQAGWAP